jgi:hypothetical protein
MGNVMALLTARNDEFKRSVNLPGFHFKSHRLTKLLNALVDYQQAPNVLKLQYLSKRLTRWQEENPKELTNRGSKCTALREEIDAQLIADGAAMPAAPPPALNIGALAWVMQKHADLSRYSTYASADALQFRGNIKEGKENEVLARTRQLTGTKGGTQPADALPSLAEWPRGPLRSIHSRVEQDQAGVCITFAKAAAHILTRDLKDPPPYRVEIVSWAVHAYVLVNRTGPVEGEKKIPDNWKHQNDLIIVDLWAAAMGYQSSVYETQGYPYQEMMNNLVLVATTENW